MEGLYTPEQLIRRKFKLACQTNDTKEIKKVLNDPDRMEICMETNFFRIAVQRNDPDMLKMFLDCPHVDFSHSVYSLEYFQHAFGIACETGATELVKLFLQDRRLDPNSSFGYGIRWACHYNRLEVVRLLMEDDRVDKCILNHDAFKDAVFVGHYDIVKMFLEYSPPGFDPNADNGAALDLATASNDLTMVKILMEDGRADPSRNSSHCLHNAIQAQNVEMIRILLDRPYNHKMYNVFRGLQMAVSIDNLGIVKMIENHMNLDLGAFEDTLVCVASEHRSIKCADYLLSRPGVNPRIGNSAPLRYACKNGDHNMVRLFLRDGRSDPAAQNQFCIRYASLNGSIECVSALLTDPRVDPTFNHDYCLVEASIRGHFNTVRRLSFCPGVDTGKIRHKRKFRRINQEFEKYYVPFLLEFLPSEVIPLISVFLGLNDIRYGENCTLKRIKRKRSASIITYMDFSLLC